MKEEEDPYAYIASMQEIARAIVALDQIENPDFNPLEHSIQDLIAYAKNLSAKLYGKDALFALELNRALNDKGTFLVISCGDPDVVATEIVKVMLSASATADRTMLTFVRDFFANTAKVLPINNG